jgi:hypothetical protein
VIIIIVSLLVQELPAKDLGALTVLRYFHIFLEVVAEVAEPLE